jgi:CheY-like chemotaxis protein
MTRIVAIDADAATLELYQQLLAETGYEVILCPDAESALERLREAAPHAIILDLRLSTDDAGWAVLRSLKEDVRLCETPVLVCTADTRVVRQCAAHLRSLGCALLLKPFNIDTFVTALRQGVEDQPSPQPSAHCLNKGELLQRQSEQHLQRAWELAVQAEDRLEEARQTLAASYRLRQRDRGATS